VQTASTYLTVLLAIDRYIAVYWPFAVKNVCTKTRAHCAALGVVAFASLYNIPRWIEMETRKQCEEISPANLINSSASLYYEYYVIVPSPLRQNSDYKKYYTFWAYFFVLNFIPFASLSFFNCSIFLAVINLTI